jgi:hypothetical protein
MLTAPENWVAARRLAPAMASPAAMTSRSPYRSAAAPQATSATMSPSRAAATSALAPASDSPSW